MSEERRQLGGYDILGEISQGAMGVVYRAQKDGGFFAIKVLKVEDDANRMAFRKEANAIARMNQPNLVKIVDYKEEVGTAFIVMELLEGKTLSTLVKEQKRLSGELFLKIAKSVARALQEIHRHNLVHRDVKPANIILTTHGQVKLLDLGFATDASELKGVAESSIVGSVFYSSAEQCRVLKRPIDGRSDLYSLGVTLFELLTGDLPFKSDDFSELLKMHATALAPTVLSRMPEASPVLSAIIFRLLQKDPDDRYQSAAGLSHDLEKIAELEKVFYSTKQLKIGAADRLIGNSELPLAGRVEEMNRLRSAWSSVRGKCGRAVVIEGESGSGKSRLVQEFVNSVIVDGAARVVKGKCQVFSSGTPFAPLREALDGLTGAAMEPDAKDEWFSLLRRAARNLEPALVEVCPAFKDIFGPLASHPSTDSEADRQRFLEDLVQFILNLSETIGTTVLVVDDIQWMDPSTYAFLSRLISRIGNSSVAILMTSRNDSENSQFLPKFKETLAGSSTEFLKLEPLSSKDVGDIVTSQVGKGALSPAVIQELTRTANGNPFVVSEIIRSLIGTGDLQFTQGSWRINEDGISAISLSNDVFKLVAARINRLEPLIRKILATAAVIGNAFDLTVVAKALRISEDQVVDAIQGALANSLVSSLGGARYRFVHDRIRESLLLSWKPGELTSVNDTLAQLIEDLADVEKNWFDLARYYSLGSLETDRLPKALRAHSIAGNIAIRNFAFVQAHHLLSFAFRLLDKCAISDSELCVLVRGLGIASTESGHEREAHAAIDIGIKNARTQLERIEFYHLKVRAYHCAGRVNEAWSTFKAAAEIIKQPFPKYAFWKWVEINWCLLNLVLRMVTGWGFRSISADSERGRYVEILSKLYYTASYASRFRAKPLDTVLMSLRAIRVSFPLEKSSYFSSAIANLGLFVGTYKFLKPANYFFQLASSLVDKAGDPSTAAYLGFIEWVTKGYSDDRKWRELNSRVEEEIGKYQGAWERSVVIRITAFQEFLSGRCNAAYAYGQSRMRLSLDTNQHTLHGAFCGDMANIALALGKTAEAVDFGLQQAKIVDSQVKDINQAAANYVMARCFLALEQGEFGPETDLLIDYFYSIGFEDHYARFAHCCIAYIRLHQLERSTNVEERKRARRQLKAALRKLYFRAYIPSYMCHWYIVKAGLARCEHKYSKALRFADRGYLLAKNADHQHGVYFASKERAEIYKAQKDQFRSQNDLLGCWSVATENSWKSRLAGIRRDYSPQLGMLRNLGSTTGSSSTISHSSHSGSLMSSVHQSTMSRATNMEKSSVTSRNDRALLALTQVSLASLASTDPSVQATAILDEIVTLFGAQRAFVFLLKAGKPTSASARPKTSELR